MSLPTLRSRLTKLERHPGVERRAWSNFYHGWFLDCVTRAVREVLPPAQQPWFLQAVCDAWPALAPTCPTSCTWGDAACQAMQQRMWDAVTAIMTAQLDSATGARLDAALITASGG
jgi:hypothetical protein